MSESFARYDAIGVRGMFLISNLEKSCCLFKVHIEW